MSAVPGPITVIVEWDAEWHPITDHLKPGFKVVGAQVSLFSTMQHITIDVVPGSDAERAIRDAMGLHS